MFPEDTTVYAVTGTYIVLLLLGLDSQGIFEISEETL